MLDPGWHRYEWRRRRLGFALIGYTLLVLLMTDLGEKSDVPSIMRVGGLLLISLTLVAFTWRSRRPLWQRTLLLPAGLVAAVALGGSLAAVLHWLRFFPHVMQGTFLYAATLPVFVFSLRFSRVFMRPKDRL